MGGRLVHAYSTARSAATSVFNEQLTLRPYLLHPRGGGGGGGGSGGEGDGVSLRGTAAAAAAAAADQGVVARRALADVAAYTKALHHRVIALRAAEAARDDSAGDRMLRALVRMQCGGGRPSTHRNIDRCKPFTSKSSAFYLYPPMSDCMNHVYMYHS